VFWHIYRPGLFAVLETARADRGQGYQGSDEIDQNLGDRTIRERTARKLTVVAHYANECQTFIIPSTF
jgi:hypothetical protein